MPEPQEPKELSSFLLKLEDHLRIRKHYQSKIKELEFATSVLKNISLEDFENCFNHIKDIVKDADANDISNVAVHSVAIVSALQSISLVEDGHETLQYFKESMHDIVSTTLDAMTKEYNEWLALLAEEVCDYISAADTEEKANAMVSKYLKSLQGDSNETNS